ncbi:flavin-containing monooxygenase [Saccharothrix australiensis]|uniref:Cation diffusion facilitator CzcD-associated flavoprotein CzcO n=1 Tax=Saccharothrix australiensis TaxID=2072 RepID=A0A495W5V7_9PSEU|nr:NAD(P)-binding domain-containing protein [Saccharothrix australiensis]RKT56043.1 cation diffusion facilitator CzcD-associated flavoprotein CzcO [Saccharothrix australiensis]
MVHDHTCVIGAGISGLAVAGTLRSRNLPVTVLERSDGVGGLWRYPDPPVPGPAYRSLHLNTSARLTGYGDFPMPADFPRYPRHDQVADYLRRYADHKGVTGHVELGAEVESLVREDDGTWLVTTRHHDGARRRRRFGHVVVASGHHWSPRLPSLPGDETFPGRRTHSFDYSDPATHAGRKVVVIGFGNSAADLAVELSRVAEKTVLVQRRGVHVVPKTMLGIPIDEIASAPWWARMTFPEQRRLIEALLRIMRGRLTDYGLAEPDHRIFGGPLTISDELLSRINHGALEVRPAIDRIVNSTLHFVDGSTTEADDLVYCTGYRIEFPFLPFEWVFEPGGQVALYQRVVSLTAPDLYFAGLIRPFGAITRLVEAQAEWIADLVEGVAELPPARAMRREVDAHLAAAKARYGPTAADSVQVDFAAYLAALRRQRRSSVLTTRRG